MLGGSIDNITCHISLSPVYSMCMALVDAPILVPLSPRPGLSETSLLPSPLALCFPVAEAGPRSQWFHPGQLSLWSCGGGDSSVAVTLCGASSNRLFEIQKACMIHEILKAVSSRDEYCGWREVRAVQLRRNHGTRNVEC